MGAVVVLGAAGTASAGELGSIDGSIFDSTCLGPCIAGADPVPYRGEATVVIRRFPDRRRIRRLAPDRDGTFEVRLPKGRYAIRIRIDDPCFTEDRRVLRLSAGGDIDRPKFFVANDCIK